MFAVDDRSALCGWEQPRQFGFALGHGQPRLIAAIKMKKIEYVVDEAFSLSLLERRLQRRKTGSPVFIFDDNLAVNQRRARGKLGNRGRDVREFFGPVETLAGEQTHLAAVEPGLHAVAVVLDLVRPAGAARRGRMQGGERRRHEIRQRRVA
jgi:hypothetical protein